MGRIIGQHNQRAGTQQAGAREYGARARGARTAWRRGGASARAVPARGDGFTLVELLVVIGVIGVLIVMLLLMLTRTISSSLRSATTARLNTIGQAITAFEQELGYEPPLLTPNEQGWEFGIDPYPSGGNRFTVPQARFYEEIGLTGDAARTAMARTRYASEFSLTVYLMGIGDLYQSNDTGNDMSSVFDDGVAGPGIANPGRDRSWGGARDRQRHAAKPGPVIGPYLDPGQFADSLELVQFGNAVGSANSRGLYRLVDSFDYPIRYYQGLLTTVPANATGATAAAIGRPTGRYLPPELRSLSSWERFTANPDGDSIGGFAMGVIDQDLVGAKWALLSAGQKGEDVDPNADPVIRSERVARMFVAPFGDAATQDGVKAMFRMEPLASASSQLSAFQEQMPLLRRNIESNVRVIGR